jgi:hypothetical protein
VYGGTQSGQLILASLRNGGRRGRRGPLFPVLVEYTYKGEFLGKGVDWEWATTFVSTNIGMYGAGELPALSVSSPSGGRWSPSEELVSAAYAEFEEVSLSGKDSFPELAKRMVDSAAGPRVAAWLGSCGGAGLEDVPARLLVQFEAPIGVDAAVEAIGLGLQEEHARTVQVTSDRDGLHGWIRRRQWRVLSGGQVRVGNSIPVPMKNRLSVEGYSASEK